jgi:hypothetical protein
MRDLRQVVQIEAQVVGPGARLCSPVLDDREVLGLILATGLGEGVARTGDEPLDELRADGVERTMLAGRSDDGPP